MKIGHVIAITVLAALLVMSIVFSIFAFVILDINDAESFRQTIICQEFMKSMSELSEDTSSDTDSEPPVVEPEDTIVDSDLPNATPVEPMVIYDANNVLVTYVDQELGLVGPTLKFYVENNCDRAITLEFTEVYIDGYIAELSGGICDSLAPGKKAYVSLTLWEVDYEDFTDFPETTEFVVRLIDPDSWYILVESDSIHINLN